MGIPKDGPPVIARGNTHGEIRSLELRHDNDFDNTPPAPDNGYPLPETPKPRRVLTKVQEVLIERAIDLVRQELYRAMTKHRSMHSAHEGYAVIAEELEELWDDVKADKGRSALEEAMQVSAMGLRFMIDLAHLTNR